MSEDALLESTSDIKTERAESSESLKCFPNEDGTTIVNFLIESDPLLIPNDNNTTMDQSIENSGVELQPENVENVNNAEDIDNGTSNSNTMSSSEPINQVDSELEGVPTDANESFQESADAIATQRDVNFIETEGKQEKSEALTVADNRNDELDEEFGTQQVTIDEKMEPVKETPEELTVANDSHDEPDVEFGTQQVTIDEKMEPVKETPEEFTVANDSHGEPDVEFGTQQVTIDEKMEPVEETSEDRKTVESPSVVDNNKLFKEIVDGEQSNKDVLEGTFETHIESLAKAENHNSLNVETDIEVNDTKETQNNKEEDIQQSADEPKDNTEPISETENKVNESSIVNTLSGNEISNLNEQALGENTNTVADTNGEETETVLESTPAKEIGFDQAIPDSLTQDDGSNNQNKSTDTIGPLQADGAQTTAIKTVALTVETITDTSQVSDNCIPNDIPIIENNIEESPSEEIHQQETQISPETETFTTSNISTNPTDTEEKNFSNVPEVEGTPEKDNETKQTDNGEGIDDALTKVIIDEEGIPRVSVIITECRPVEALPLSQEGNGDSVQAPVPLEVIITEETITDNSQVADNGVPTDTSVIENSIDESSPVVTDQQETQISADTDTFTTSNISANPTELEENNFPNLPDVEDTGEKGSKLNLTDNGEGVDETLTKVIVDDEGIPRMSNTDQTEDQAVEALPQEGNEEADTEKDIANKEDTHLQVSAADSSIDVEPMASSDVPISLDDNTVESPDETNEINYQDDFEEETNTMETHEETNENDVPSTTSIENEPDNVVAAQEESSESSNTQDNAYKNNEELTSENAGAPKSTDSESMENADRNEAINEDEPILPVKELSPLEQLLQRNVTIYGDVSSIPEYEAKLTNLLKSMEDVLKHNLDVLKMQSLKDFTADLGKFRGDMQTINDAFMKCSTMSENITCVLKELRQSTEEVTSQIMRKFQQEDLSTWIDNEEEHNKAREMLKETIEAEERRCLAKAAEARHAAAVASTGVAQAQQLVADMEALAAEADTQAKLAAAMAAAAVVAAEEARVAALEKRRAEEEAKRRAVEKARIKAEEEDKKRAEEEMKIQEEAAKKGTDIEDERKTFLEEKAIREAERKNPKNWPCYMYDGKGIDFKPPMACIIRAIEGSMTKTDITCKCVDQSTGVLALGESEELVSNIIELQQTDESLQLHFEESMSIAFPISLSRLPTGKETVIRKKGHDGVWRVLPASDTHFDDYKELKFLECRSATFGLFAVIMRPKRDQLTFTRRGNKPACSFDSRHFFLNRRGTVKRNVNVQLEVNPLDMNLVPDLRARAPRECEDLLTASSIITVRAPPEFVLQKPLTVSVPLPQIQKRPTTSRVAKETRVADLRPLTARPSEPTEGDETESVHVLCRDVRGGWTILRDVNLVSHTNKDVVTFNVTEFRERYILLRTKPDKRDSAVEKMASLIEQASYRRNVKIILRQRNTNILEVKVACTIANAADRTTKALGEEGFMEGPPPSGDVSLREGQKLYMRFRGNLECATKSPRLSLIFNSNIRATTRFLVQEKDPYAQKGLNCYRGFVQIFTKAMIPRPPAAGAAKNSVPQTVEAEILLTELLVELPKPEAMPPKPLATAPIFIKEGAMTNGVLRMLAGQLGNEWRDLAEELGVPRMRIQAILRQHVNMDTSDTRYDMLVTWAKRVPKSIDKVQVLSEALEDCGRKDLAEEVRQKGQRYKQQRFICARVSHLKQAFVKVAKANDVFGNWKGFAKKLGVQDDDIAVYRSPRGSGQEMCYSSLEAWQTTAGEDATITALANHLRSDHQEKLSRDVESIGLMGALMT